MKNSLGSLLAFMFTLLAAAVSVTVLVTEHFDGIVSWLARTKEKVAALFAKP